MKFSTLTMMGFALCSAAACSPTVTQPCDLLVPIPDAPPAVNRILVEQARPTAVALAQHRGRVKRYGCGQ